MTRSRREVDTTAGFPGAVLPSHSHSTSTVHVTDRGDNCEYWLHTPRAGCHRLLGLARAGAASGRWDTAASHLVGAQNPDPRSGQLSRAGPREEEHNLREKPCVVMQVEELAQTRSSSRDRDEADGLTPSGGSTPIGKPVASTPVPRPNDYTIGQDQSPDLHLKAEVQRPRDAGTTQRHRGQ